MPRTRRLSALYDLADRQDGFFTTGQAAALSVDNAGIAKAAASGRFRRVSRGLYQSTLSTPPPSRQHLWEAALWPLGASEGAGVLSHETALALHGFGEPNPERVHITVPKSFRLRREPPAWLVIHREQLKLTDVITSDGLTVTSVARTLVDVAPTLDAENFEALKREIKRLGYDLAALDEPEEATATRARRKSLPTEPTSKQILAEAEVPSDFSFIPELDLRGELCTERLPEPWCVLGVRTKRTRLGALEIVSERETLLIGTGEFRTIFDELSYIGNVLSRLGAPGGVVSHGRQGKSYSYVPYHQFQFRSSEVVGEPMAFVRETSQGLSLSLNPDIILYLRLEERSRGVWVDPRSGAEVVVQTTNDNADDIKVRTSYLRRYLRARRMSLLVGYFQRRMYFNPSRELIDAFKAGELVLGSPGQGAKALVLSTESSSRFLSVDPYLRRELHLWYQVEPGPLDVDHAFEDEPSFDIFSFTLPTSDGSVAPARFRTTSTEYNQPFDGVPGDFLDQVYFRQEVLTKYEGAAGFEVADDGSVVCGHYWALNRSTCRLGNDLLCTFIGDFAEGIPFEEWPHWKLYAVEPPTGESSSWYTDEKTIVACVNDVARSLEDLNRAFALFSGVIGVSPEEPLWAGSLKSLAGRQLKSHYRHDATADEFLKRAVLLSTFVSEELSIAAIRRVALALGPKFHLGADGKPLASRNLLARLSLAASIASAMTLSGDALVDLVAQAESGAGPDRDLDAELRELRSKVRETFAPIAFLYDLRNSSGFAHAGSMEAAQKAAEDLGLSTERWSRADYVELLQRVRKAIETISACFNSAAWTLAPRDLRSHSSS